MALYLRPVPVACPAQKNNIIEQFAGLTSRVESVDYALHGITAIKELGILAKQYGLAPKYIELLNEIKGRRLLLNDSASVQRAKEAVSEIERH